ncbi:hypothetical protein D3C75_1157610 [compost metagenome]
MVFTAAGAIAAPILKGSLIPISITLPMVARVTRGPRPWGASTAAPAPVTVNWAVGGFCPPYSVGYRNCFSTVQLWLQVPASTYCAEPEETMSDPRARLSIAVEQAPKTPK